MMLRGLYLPGIRAIRAEDSRHVHRVCFRDVWLEHCEAAVDQKLVHTLPLMLHDAVFLKVTS